MHLYLVIYSVLLAQMGDLFCTYPNVWWPLLYTNLQLVTSFVKAPPIGIRASRHWLFVSCTRWFWLKMIHIADAITISSLYFPTWIKFADIDVLPQIFRFSSEGVLKIPRHNQVGNNLSAWNLLVIMHIHPTVQHTWIPMSAGAKNTDCIFCRVARLPQQKGVSWIRY